jgi:hypothetical protein
MKGSLPVKSVVAAVFFMAPQVAAAQIRPEYRNSGFVEFAGNGLLLSANYERILTTNPYFLLRAGFGLYPSDPIKLTIPLSFGYMLPLDREKSQFVELGVGLTYVKADVRLYQVVDYTNGAPKASEVQFVPSLNYRVHARNGSIFKIGLTPVYNQHGWIPYFGVCYGKMF